MDIAVRTKKICIMWALFMLMLGVIGLSIQYMQKSARQSRIALAAQRVAKNPVAEEYKQAYEQWSNLPAADKVENPWGYGTYGGSDIQERLSEQQPDQFLADLPELEKGILCYSDELRDAVYGAGWRQEVDRCKNRGTTTELILIGSTFLSVGGGLILGGVLGKLLIVYALKKRSEGAEASEDAELSDLKSGGENVEDTPDPGGPQAEVPSSEPFALQQKKQKRPEQQEDNGYFKASQNAAQDASSKSEDSKATELPMKPQNPFFDFSEKKQKDSYFGWAIKEDGATELDTLMTTEPLTKELTELTEEVSAIRQFAASQQDQMRRLQDGYDWMIVRRFCLRIIRSVDNIDDRVIRLRANGEDAAAYLEDIRDELVFAMEASGIEQFGPDLNKPFKGLEKYAEAVRERIFTEDRDLVGCIAEVMRPGYQYLVNDDDVKIVRCAQVKLYESKQP